MLCVGVTAVRRASYSGESTPLHADWPTAYLSMSAQQSDQSQDAHLSREPVLPGIEASSTVEAGHSSVSCLSDSEQLMRTKDSRALEPSQLANTELSSVEPKNVKDQPVTEVELSSSVVADDQRQVESVDIESSTPASQETRTITVEQKSVSTVLDESIECVRLASISEHTRLDDDRSQHCETAVCTRQPTETDVVRGLAGHQQTDANTEVQSRCLEVVGSPTLQQVQSHSQPQSDSTLSPSAVCHQLTTAGNAISIRFGFQRIPSLFITLHLHASKAANCHIFGPSMCVCVSTQ